MHIHKHTHTYPVLFFFQLTNHEIMLLRSRHEWKIKNGRKISIHVLYYRLLKPGWIQSVTVPLVVVLMVRLFVGVLKVALPPRCLLVSQGLPQHHCVAGVTGSMTTHQHQVVATSHFVIQVILQIKHLFKLILEILEV